MKNVKPIFNPKFGKESAFGYMPYILSLVIGFGIFFLLFFLFLKVDKAKHLVFYDFDSVDPFFSTYLIFIYGFLCAGIFVHHMKTDPKSQDDKSDHLPKSLYIANIVLAMLPSTYWLFLLLANKPTQHLYSIIISVGMIIYLGLLYFNVGPTGERFDPKQKFTNFFILEDYFKSINRFLAFIIIIIFIYFLFTYETRYLQPITRFFEKIPHTTSWLKHLYFILTIGFVTAVYQFWTIIQEKAGKWFYVIIPLTILLSISLLTIGTIPALDVILLGAIVARVLLFELGEISKLAYKLFIDDNYKMAWRQKIKGLSPREYTTLCVFFILFIPGVFHFSMDKSQKISMYEMKYIDYVPSPADTTSLSEAAALWMASRGDDPVYVFAGQGGGSRAGCTMFSVLSLLDSFPTIKNNTFAITTISGSSNGAAFYLASRGRDSFIAQGLQEQAMQLYNVDYVTKSLYKLIFTDHFLVKAITRHKSFNRNDNLIDLESRSLGGTKKLKSLTWRDWYSTPMPDKPVFLPVTYNISRGLPAVSSPYAYDIPEKANYFSILDSLKTKNKTIGISQSVALSQMFPMISASAVVDGNNYMDGGVYDNGPFESLDNVYQVLSRERDRLNPAKRIILVTVENGRYDVDHTAYSSQLSATTAAATRSIFTSNPIVHREDIRQKLINGDTMVNLTVYKPKEAPQTKKWFNPARFLRIKADTSSVVMSRYLTKDEIGFIIQKSKQEIKKIPTKN